MDRRMDDQQRRKMEDARLDEELARIRQIEETGKVDKVWEAEVDREIERSQRQVDEMLALESRPDRPNKLTEDSEARLAALKEGLGSRPTDKGESALRKEQGNIGEGIALETGVKHLGLTPDPRFDAPYHGYDAVCRDAQGRLVILEAKCDQRGIRALGEDQMQPAWVEREALRIQKESSTAFTPGNREIGAEVIAQGAGNIRRVVCCLDQKRLEVMAWEGQRDGLWKPIGRWSALDLEQPNLKA